MKVKTVRIIKQLRRQQVVTEAPKAPETDSPVSATTETPDETNNGPVDNGSTEVAEKW